MGTGNTVTCSFKLDRDLYDEYKSIVVRNHENVKGNLVRYMQDVVDYGTPNRETIEAAKEIDEMRKNPELGKAYNDVDEMFEDLLA